MSGCKKTGTKCDSRGKNYNKDKQTDVMNGWGEWGCKDCGQWGKEAHA